MSYPRDTAVEIIGPELVTQRGVGVVAPFDFALDRELWRWAPDDISLYVTRLPFVPVPVTVEMAAELSDPERVRRATADVLAPEPLVVTYACASASFVGGKNGEHALTQSMVDAGAPLATTTSGGLIDAVRMLGLRKIAVVTPYIDSVTERLLCGNFLVPEDRSKSGGRSVVLNVVVVPATAAWASTSSVSPEWTIMPLLVSPPLTTVLVKRSVVVIRPLGGAA